MKLLILGLKGPKWPFGGAKRVQNMSGISLFLNVYSTWFDLLDISKVQPCMTNLHKQNGRHYLKKAKLRSVVLGINCVINYVNYLCFPQQMVPLWPPGPRINRIHLMGCYRCYTLYSQSTLYHCIQLLFNLI